MLCKWSPWLEIYIKTVREPLKQLCSRGYRCFNSSEATVLLLLTQWDDLQSPTQYSAIAATKVRKQKVKKYHFPNTQNVSVEAMKTLSGVPVDDRT